MNHRSLAAWAAIIVLVGLAPVSSFGQGQAKEGAADPAPEWTMPRLPDGQPDLQGYWTTQTFTPLERPEHLADVEFFTAEEAAALNAQLTAEGVDPSARDAVAIEDPEAREQRLYQVNRDRTYVHYDNEIWLRTPVPKGLSSRRTSLITDPPNGRIPPLTPEAEQRLAAEAEARRSPSAFDSHETRPLPERCIVWRHEGPPTVPPAYNDIHQIFQTPDYVVLFTELTTNLPRIIPLDGRPHVPDAVRHFAGDSRGRWEGDTLVVETTNFNERRRFQGATEAMRVVERFTRVAADRIHYEFTVEDPDTWTRPWSAEVPMVTTEGPMYEYACHEGNHDIRHILEIYRNLEQQAAAAEAAAPTGASVEGVQHGVLPLVLQWETADWGPPSDRPGFPAGLRNAAIATDPATGGPTYLARFPAGSEFAMHWHTYTETVVVLEGAVDIVMDGTRYTATAGSYVIIPEKAHHAWYTHADADAVLLARRDGPADFHFVEP